VRNTPNVDPFGGVSLTYAKVVELGPTKLACRALNSLRRIFIHHHKA
jgi:hypothetical protein